MEAEPFLLVFDGGVGGSPVEDLVAAARRAAALDSLERALDTGAYAGDALAHVSPLPESDNPLPRLLNDAAGLPVETLPRTIATLLDIDTPTALAALALYGRTGPRLARLLATADLDLEPYRRMMACIP